MNRQTVESRPKHLQSGVVGIEFMQIDLSHCIFKRNFFDRRRQKKSVQINFELIGCHCVALSFLLDLFRIEKKLIIVKT